jgi:SAM-dependent methyltransferase
VRRQICGGCRSTNLVEWLDLGSSPLANDYPKQPNTNLAQYPLGLVRCYRCTLVQSTDVVPDNELWNREYGFYTGGSWQVVEQQRDYAYEVMQNFGSLSDGLVVEVACNDGTMLKNFKEAGWRTLGVDPARGPAAKAQVAGLDVIVEQFCSNVAEEIINQYGQASIIVANNVIAHVADLDDFIRGFRLLLQPQGVAIVEFQYVGDLITGNQFDHVYHEHRSFFSLSSLRQALARYGLEPVHVKQTNPQGGSLRVTIRLKAGPVDVSVWELLDSERWLEDPNCLAGMQGRADRIRHRLVRLLQELKKQGKVVAGYGAPAKSATLLNFCGIGPDLVQYIVDTTPAKQGRYTPGTNIPIINPESDSRAPDVYLLLNWNYLHSIRRKESSFTGEWLVPIPLPELA